MATLAKVGEISCDWKGVFLQMTLKTETHKICAFLQVGLLNVDGYYNSLLSFIDKAVEEGFISPSARHIIISAPTPKELVKKLEVINFLLLTRGTRQIVYFAMI